MAEDSPTRYDALFALRDAYRQRAQAGMSIVHGDELPWEDNRQGRMKWFLHPQKDDTVIRTLLVWEQEIPPGGRTGKQEVPGGIMHYVLEGVGYSIVNGVRYDWKEGDGIGLPVKPEGVICQHFNLSPDRPARFIAAMPNLFEVLGADLGSRFEQLEDAPRE
jgi:quercetin dioxygenase-like cupin family protein